MVKKFTLQNISNVVIKSSCQMWMETYFVLLSVMLDRHKNLFISNDNIAFHCHLYWQRGKHINITKDIEARWHIGVSSVSGFGDQSSNPEEGE